MTFLKKSAKKCGKALPLRWGSATCERRKSHQGLHRRYARRGPGGSPSISFSEAHLKQALEEPSET